MHWWSSWWSLELITPKITKNWCKSLFNMLHLMQHEGFAPFPAHLSCRNDDRCVGPKNCPKKRFRHIDRLADVSPDPRRPYAFRYLQFRLPSMWSLVNLGGFPLSHSSRLLLHQGLHGHQSNGRHHWLETTHVWCLNVSIRLNWVYCGWRHLFHSFSSL